MRWRRWVLGLWTALSLFVIFGELHNTAWWAIGTYFRNISKPYLTSVEMSILTDYDTEQHCNFHVGSCHPWSYTPELMEKGYAAESPDPKEWYAEKQRYMARIKENPAIMQDLLRQSEQMAIRLWGGSAVHELMRRLYSDLKVIVVGYIVILLGFGVTTLISKLRN